MIDDLRYAFRQLRKNPGFATVAVLTLALGIGAAAAMFGVIQGVLLSPPPYAAPDRLVLLSPARVDGEPYTQGVTTGQWLAWRGSSRTIDRPALYSWTFNFLVLPDGSESLGGMIVTPDYFRVLGIQPLIGRVWSEREARRPPQVPAMAIVIGYDLWQRRFNGDPGVIGRTLVLSRQPAPLPIVGVMPPGIRFLPDPGDASEPNYDVDAPVDFWVAAMPDEAAPQSGSWNAIARLRDGVPVADAGREIARITSRYNATEPRLEGLTMAVQPLPEVLNADGRRLLLPLFGAVALVFVIACGNVTGLLLARGLQRQPEYALRSALGAGRRRLFRQVLTESVALAVLGAIAGAGVAAALVALLKAVGSDAIPRADAIHVGWPVFLFAVVAALIAAVLAGLLPAVRASRPAAAQGLEGTRASAGRAERRLLGGVAALQIMLTVALLAGAALLVRTAINLASVRPGYDTTRVLAMTVTSVQPRERWMDFHTRVLADVAAMPGVTHAAFVWGLPLTGNKWTWEIVIDGRAGATAVTDRITVPQRAVTSDYFAAMGIPIVDGRGFTPTDGMDERQEPIAIVNRAFVRRHFPDTHPIGRTLRTAGSNNKPLTIVGIAADTRTDALSAAAEPEVYIPLFQTRAFSKHLILRARTEPQALAAQTLKVVRAIDPSAAIEGVKTMEEIRAESVAARTFAMYLLTGFAIVATILALVGLYGVLALSVGSRVKEIAVRKAIGAQRHQILRLILGEGLRLIAVGVLFGTMAALLLGPVLQALLFDVSPADPVTLASAAALFGLVSLLACALPAWRAVGVDLMDALRQS